MKALSFITETKQEKENHTFNTFFSVQKYSEKEDST